jgi:hypothetical protein
MLSISEVKDTGFLHLNVLAHIKVSGLLPNVTVNTTVLKFEYYGFIAGAL